MNLWVSKKRSLKLPKLLSGTQVAVRAAMSASLSTALATLLRLQLPMYAMLAAVIVTDLSPLQTRKLGFRRIVSTIVGAACGALLSTEIRPGAWEIGIGIFLVMLICNFLRVQNAAKTGGYICAIVLMGHASDPWTYALFRFVETIIGIVVAWLISCVPLLFQTEESSR